MNSPIATNTDARPSPDFLHPHPEYEQPEPTPHLMMLTSVELDALARIFPPLWDALQNGAGLSREPSGEVCLEIDAGAFILVMGSEWPLKFTPRGWHNTTRPVPDGIRYIDDLRFGLLVDFVKPFAAFGAVDGDEARDYAAVNVLREVGLIERASLRDVYEAA